MKSLAAVLILLLATTAFAAWSSSGPTGGQVRAVVVAPSDPTVIWAGNSAGVFRSTDSGATWSNVSGPIADVAFLAVHPADAKKAWALTGWAEAARLYRTNDGGATWIDSTDGLPAIRPSALLIDPRNPDTLYAGSHCGPIGFAVVASLAPQPQFHETAGVFKSTDGGVTWKPSFNGLGGFTQCAEELAIDPFSPWRLFITGPFSDVAGQHESYDNAQSWERTDTPRPGRGIVFDARFPFTHYGISSTLGSKFLVSQDGGFTWSVVNTNLFAQTIVTPTALSMDPERSRIFLGTTNGLFRSGNGGTVWAKTSVQDVGLNALDFGGEPRALFAGTTTGLVQVLNRGLGASRPIDLHDASANVLGLAIDPGDPNIVYAGVRVPSVNIAFRGRVFRSTDGGASWQRAAGDDDVWKADFMSVDAAGTLYAISYVTTSIYRRGRDETKWTVSPDHVAYDIAADPKNAGTVFLAVIGGVERSRDGGVTWKHVAGLTGAGKIAVDPSDPSWVYAGSEYDLLRSSDGGDTWTDMEPFVAGSGGTRGIVVAPSNGKVLYRIGAHGGAPRPERSDDRAATWTPVPLPNNIYPSAVAVDPRDESSVWAAAFNGALYHSVNGGATWQKVDGPFLTSIGATAMRIDPAGHRLHIAFPEHGVWELGLE